MPEGAVERSALPAGIAVVGLGCSKFSCLLLRERPAAIRDVYQKYPELPDASGPTTER
jgi:hypothetical protein